MAGTLATFAGLVCSDVRTSWSRGYDSDLSVVEIPVGRFPEGLVLAPPKPGQVGGEIAKQVPDLSRIKLDMSAPGFTPVALKQERLVFAGTLCVAEANATEEWKVVRHPLYVVRVERVRASRTGGVARLRVTLCDERHFPRGFLYQWSYNRVRADKSLALDSVKADGKPYSLAEICDKVVASMLRSPAVSATPETWSQRFPPMEFPPLCPPVTALAELERRGGTEPPCLRLDGSFAFHRLGEGRVGWAPNGVGPNTQDFPEPLRLWKQGQGEGYSVELSYPDDYVVVRGRERIQTVALDDCEPVLVVQITSANPDRALGTDLEHQEDVEKVDDFLVGEPRVLPLCDAVVRRLTDDKLNLETLRRWVLQPRVYQDALDLEERIARVLRDQAWRLWRIPKVVVYDDPALVDSFNGTPEEQKRLRELLQGFGEGTSSERAEAMREFDALRKKIVDRSHAVGALDSGSVLNPASRPGPNANLLPLLPCAETVDGRRVPLLVQTFRHRTRHQVLNGSTEVSKRGTRARVRMAEVLREADAVADVKQVAPVREGTAGLFSDPGELNLDTLGGEEAAAAGADLGAFREAVEQTRLIERLRELDGELATRYEQELRKSAQAASDLRGTPDVELLDLAKKALAFEGRVREAADEIFLELDTTRTGAQRVLDTGKGLSAQEFENLKRLQSVFRDSIKEDLRAIARNADAQRQQSRSGVTRVDMIPNESGPLVVVNLPRSRDHGARVYSAELGIFEVSSLPGHADPAGSPEPAVCRFVPMPVRVAFGATVRPKPGDGHATMEGGNRLGNLADQVTWFTRAFKRGEAPGVALPVPLRAVPPGEATIVPLNENELIPIAGEGNTSILEEEALALAKERFRPKPKVEAATYVIARPWPVQCDGVVRGVEIVMRPGGQGFETRISVGSGTWDRNPARTRNRPKPPRDVDDGRNREGTQAK